jgi:hypothetical protein
VKAIGVIYEQYHNPTFDRLIRTFAAIVFLGCPHPTFDEPQQWAKVSLILKANPCLPKVAIEQAGNNVAEIANISKAFDESNHDIDIISAFEGKPTRIRRAVLKRHFVRVHLAILFERILTVLELVEESLARTKSKRETMVKVDAQHSELCVLTAGSPFHIQLSQLLGTVRNFVPSTHAQALAAGCPPFLICNISDS